MPLTYSWGLPRGGAVLPVRPSSFYSTSFLSTENPISEGGVWVNGLSAGLDWQNLQTTGGVAAATHKMLTSPPYDDCIAHISSSAVSFPENQYAQGTVFRSSGYTAGHEIELLVRFSITANVARGYELYWSTNGGLVLVRWNGALNDFNPLASSSPGLATTGDVLRLEVLGSLLTAKINGATQFTFTDTSWSTGQPGIGQNPYEAASDFTSYAWSDFTAGAL